MGNDQMIDRGSYHVLIEMRTNDGADVGPLKRRDEALASDVADHMVVCVWWRMHAIDGIG
jgi:hypothetical protein